MKPTPWHPFDLPEPDSWTRISRFPTIIKCSYLSCLYGTRPSTVFNQIHSNSTSTCPSYFQWIYEDLSPWRQKGITREQLQSAQEHAAFRVIIVKGRLYTEFYYACVLPRAFFTLWGLLQLLERYPGMVPDVDLMFDCMDRPSVRKAHYKHMHISPPLFRYCGHKEAYDIPFPDWSFWGWPQINLPPWSTEAENIFKASKFVKWEDRKRSAYWKGNPDVGSAVRQNLLLCNKTDVNDWGAEIYRQDWWSESLGGYRNSELSQQCKHRYKIYTEGHAWSVSFKYIMACDSTVLVALPTYYEFFSRGLMPMAHYWPVRKDKLCSSIKYAVNWGNEHTEKVKAMGSAGQEFMWRNLTMDFVYDYMFHLLTEYAKLQKFIPVIPETAQLLCKNAILCFTDDPRSKEYLKMSEARVSSSPPCILPPFDTKFINEFQQVAENVTQRIWMMEDSAQEK
ncbi:hypothetical protein KP509_34G007500 [Ceratopteris richardii]|nr:hypothetical protein KP509_34G007500 [Ceratopteris richardii]